MNLAECIVIKHKRPDWHYFTLNGEPFSELQCALYDAFADAIESRTRLVLPTNTAYRGAGKSEVIRVLSKNYNIIYCDNTGLYNILSDGTIARRRTMRLINSNIVLVDDLHSEAYERTCEVRGLHITPIGTRLSDTYQLAENERSAYEEIRELSRSFTGGENRWN